MNRLYIIHKLPTPYNDDLFRAIHAEPDIVLKVFHLWRGSSRRPWKSELATGYPNRFMRTTLGIDWHALGVAWRDRESLFLVGDWAHLPTIALLLARIARNAPVAIWVDTPQEQLERPLLKRKLRSAFLTRLLRNVDFILASGRPARRALVGMGASPDMVIDFQLVVDLDKPVLEARDPSLRERAVELRDRVGCSTGVVFAISGTIEFSKKAQDVGVRAFAGALMRSDIRLGLLIAGTGPDLERLKAMVQELGIADRVAFLGWQEPAEMASVYMACDALFHPAHYDPFPLVVIEAMSYSRPVIGTSTSGSVEERVDSGVNGFVVPPGDESSMTDALVDFAEGGVARSEMAQKARARAEEWPMARAVAVVRDALADARKEGVRGSREAVGRDGCAP